MVKKTEQNSYEIVIEPKKSFLINLKELLHYKDLLWFLVRRDFISKYRQTILGPLWFILQPLITTLVFTIFFNGITKIPTDRLPPTLFYLCGLLVWDYFSRCVNSTSVSLISSANLIQKVYFPRLIIPLSNILSNLFSFFIQLITFLTFYFYFNFFTPASIYIRPNISIIFLPLLLLQTALFALGVGLWVCALTTKYRDIQYLMAFIIQLWLYATPVIYPVSVIPARWRFILALNPIAAIIDLFRYAFFGSIYLSYKYLLISIGTTIFVLLSGLIIFNKVEYTITDTI